MRSCDRRPIASKATRATGGGTWRNVARSGAVRDVGAGTRKARPVSRACPAWSKRRTASCPLAPKAVDGIRDGRHDTRGLGREFSRASPPRAAGRHVGGEARCPRTASSTIAGTVASPRLSPTGNVGAVADQMLVARGGCYPNSRRRGPRRPHGPRIRTTAGAEGAGLDACAICRSAALGIGTASVPSQDHARSSSSSAIRLENGNGFCRKG